MKLNTLAAAVLLATAGAAFAQTPAVTPAQAPAVTPSQTPAVTPSQTPSVVGTPSVGGTSVGGLSRCENMIGVERDTCMRNERAGTSRGGAAGAPAGAGGTHAPGSTGTGMGTSVR